MTNPGPTALIAEDEALLAQALQAELARAWPELQVLAVVGDGATAVTQTLALRPEVLFFDIRMPGRNGLDAAAEIAEEWPEGEPFPALVFVTAYDQHAMQAFEAQAVDYVLKPVQAGRLEKTVARVRALLAARRGPEAMDATLAQLRSLLAPGAGQAASTQPLLRTVQASVGQAIHVVAVKDILYFEASDKYVRVLTAQREYLLRTALKELMPRLDPADFWQVHRGTVVRADAIDSVTRDESGKLAISLHGRTEKLSVSRLYAHLFKAM